LPTAAVAAALVRSVHFGPPPVGAGGLDATGAGEVATGLLAAVVALAAGAPAELDTGALAAGAAAVVIDACVD
jgi:hypothetical protein